MSELDRRDFLKLVGAGAGAAAAAGCSDPIEKLVPYVIQPEEITPGIPVDYASTCRECPAGCGLHVRTREGRPIKLEGNPDHPINQGKLCPRGQAGIGRTYHPDRYAAPMKRGASGSLEPASWEDAQALLVEKLRTQAGRTWVLGGDRGPAVNGIIDAFSSGIGAAGRIVYEPFGQDSLREATQIVFGTPSLPIFDLSGADLVIDFGSNFLDTGISPVEHGRQFAAAQDIAKHPDGGAALVAIGPRMSLTTSNADVWIPAAPGSEGMIAAAVGAAVAKRRGVVPELARGADTALAGADLGEAASLAGVDRKLLDDLVERVLAAKAPVALPPGVASTGSGAVSSIAAVLLLDAIVGALGSSLFVPPQPSGPRPASLKELKRFTKLMRSGDVKVLLIHDANPIYSLPQALGFAEALEQVDLVVSFAPLADETSERAHLVVPDHTPLESWGDAQPRDGIHSIVQPTVRPLHDTQALGDTLLAVGNALGARGLAQGSVRTIIEQGWSGTNFREALARGGEFGSGPPATVAVATPPRVDPKAPNLQGSGDFTLVAYPHSFLWDGSGAALPWLQEIPDPVAKASWVTWAEISKETARRLGLEFGHTIEIETGFGAGKIAVPVYPRGGIRDDVVAVAIGQGHTVGYYASLAGDGEPGVARGASVISLLPAVEDERGGRAWLATRATVTPAGGFRRIPLSQWTDNQRERGLAQEVSLVALAEAKAASAEQPAHADDGHGGAEHGGDHGEGEPHELLVDYDRANDARGDSDYRWGLTIDNDRCTGCSACVAACYVENNIPVVGQDGMTRHREMSWIRIERYVGDGEVVGGEERRPHPDREELGKVDIRQSAMLCQQCGAAPCESVCPVIATYHTPEGLNAMIYNRCVGTRYCANNCVYKVRRFNYWDYSQHNWPGLMGLMLNPDVTVRGQGVMEKCTFCVQRIERARQTAKDEGRPIADGEIVTACQQTCPTDAITFGNTRNPESQVVKKADAPGRAYHSLQVLNTRPAITYLAQVNRQDEEHDG